MKRRIARLAAAAFVSAGMTLAAFGQGIGVAQADSGTWCPGDPVPGGFTEVDWDWNVCHNYYAPVSGNPPVITVLKVEDGGHGGNWRVVAGINPSPCPFCW